MTSSPLKIVFAGTPVFASIALEALTLSQHDVIAVYTQPDRQSGRGLKVTKSPVKELAFDKDIPTYQPKTLRDEKAQAQFKELKPDLLIVAAYGLILPKEILEIPRLGCINIHASLLPRWRGAAPIQQAILAGDKTTGITIMQMDEGLDTGDMLLKHEYTLAHDENSQTLHDRLAKMGAEAIVEALDLLVAGKLKPEKQNDKIATHAGKIQKQDALIDWHHPAVVIDRKVRAFNPWPVAFFAWNGDNVRVWEAEVINLQSNEAPGTIINASAHGIDVATSEGVLRLLKLQLPGGKPLSVADFYNAHHQKMTIGTALV